MTILFIQVMSNLESSLVHPGMIFLSSGSNVSVVILLLMVRMLEGMLID